MAWQFLCNLDELAAGQGHEFVVQDRVVAVFSKAGQLYALDGMCAHQGGPIAQGMLDGNCLTCPWHGWQYDITSGVNVRTGRQMLDCFSLDIRDGQVWIELND